MGLEEYSKSSRLSRPPPINPFDHSYRIVDRTRQELEFNDRGHSGIIDGVSAYTGNIAKKDIDLYREDGLRLNIWYEMAKHEPALRASFESILYGWHSSIEITKNIDSGERWLQAAAGSLSNIGTLDSFRQQQEQAKQQFQEQQAQQSSPEVTGIFGALKKWREDKKRENKVQ